MDSGMESVFVSNGSLWAGRIVSGIVVLVYDFRRRHEGDEGTAGDRRRRANRIGHPKGVTKNALLTSMIGVIGAERRQAVNMDLSNATAWFATTAMRFHRLWCPFGEVQQDLLLSSLTIG
jgi:hypothetical protein